MISALEAETLFTEQAMDLVRYRALVEAQVAVVGMTDVSLLHRLGREADALIDRVTLRDRRIQGIPRSPAWNEPATRVELARRSARWAVDRLVAALNLESARVSRELAEKTQDPDDLELRYPLPSQRVGSPILIDRSA